MATLDEVKTRLADALEALKEVLNLLDAQKPPAEEPPPVVEPPPATGNLLPESLRDGGTAANWQSESAKVSGLTPGREYELTLTATVTKWTSVAAWVAGAQVLKVNQPQGQAFVARARFKAATETAEIRIGGGKDGTGNVVWSNGTLTAASAAQEPPAQEPPPVVEPGPVNPPPSSPASLAMMVNVAGAEFGSGSVMNKDYVYASNAYFDDMLKLAPWKGFRLPFKWPRVQPALGGALDAAHVKEIDRIVQHVTGKGLVIVLDGHDYGRRDGEVIDGTGSIRREHYADFWSKIAAKWGANPLVWYNTNEPHDQDAAEWWITAQMMVDAIRKAGGKGKILMPGSHWTGAHSFVKTDAGSNSKTYEANPIEDANFAIDVHQYFDTDSSGTKNVVVEGAATRVNAITAWAKARGVQLYLGEWAFPDTPEGHREAHAMLRTMADSGVWIGAAYWASGPWWKKTDWNIVGPGSGNGQLNTIRKFM